MKPKENLTQAKIMALLQEHHLALKKYKVKRIGLFGSHVAGSQRQRSDIDFLVEFEEPTFDNFMGLNSYLQDLIGRKIDLITPVGLSQHIKPNVENEVEWHEVR